MGPTSYGGRDDGAVTVAGGDGGGPVYRIRPDGLLGARGVIFGGSVFQPCPTLHYSGNPCYSTVFYVNIRSILDRWDASLKIPSP